MKHFKPFLFFKELVSEICCTVIHSFLVLFESSPNKNAFNSVQRYHFFVEGTIHSVKI